MRILRTRGYVWRKTKGVACVSTALLGSISARGDKVRRERERRRTVSIRVQDEDVRPPAAPSLLLKLSFPRFDIFGVLFFLYFADDRKSVIPVACITPRLCVRSNQMGVQSGRFRFNKPRSSSRILSPIGMCPVGKCTVQAVSSGLLFALFGARRGFGHERLLILNRVLIKFVCRFRGNVGTWLLPC